MNENIELVRERSSIIFETVSDIVDGRLDIGSNTSPNLLDGLKFSYAIMNRNIQKYIRAFANSTPTLLIDECSVESTIEDVVEVAGVYIPGPTRLLHLEVELIEELNEAITYYLNSRNN